MELPLKPDDVLRPVAPVSRECVEGDGTAVLVAGGQDRVETASDRPRDLYREIPQQTPGSFHDLSQSVAQTADPAPQPTSKREQLRIYHQR